MALLVTKFLLFLSFAATLASSRFVISRPDVTNNHHKVFSNFEQQYPTTNLVPSNLKVDDNTFSKLIDQLDKQLSDDYNMNPMAGYFPKDVENDDWDELEFINNYDETVDEDDIDAVFNVPDSGASVTAQFGRREFSFSKVLSVNHNGTKSFSKVRQSVKAEGNAKADISGNLNTTVVDKSSATANFAVNVSVSSKGKDVRTSVTGETTITGLSKSKVDKRKSLSDSNIESTTKVHVSSVDEDVTVKTTGRSDSETFRLPFRTFFTLFGTSVNTTTDFGVGSSGKVGGEVTSHIAYASKNSSLTKSCVKIFIKTKSTTGVTLRRDDSDEEDNDQDIDMSDEDTNEANNEKQSDDDSTSFLQVVLVKAKTHTWTKVVSASKTGIVLDIVTCTKARAYSKGIQKGKSVAFVGTGQVSWEKSQLKISGSDLENLSTHEYGIYSLNKQLESGTLFGFGGATGVN